MAVSRAPSGDTARRRRFPHPHRGRPEPLRNVGRLLRVLGPGLITGAADDDPSGIGTYSQVGAAYGAGMLWLALYMLPLMIAVQEMCGRIGLVTGQGIAGVVRRQYSRKILYGAVALLLLANTINVGADLGAMAVSTHLLLPHVPDAVLLVVFALGILLLEIFVSYRQYARVLKLLTLSLLAYILTGIIVHPDWGQLLLRTIVPNVQFTPAFLALVVGVLGTTISPYLFFWQASEEVEEAELHGRLHTGSDRKRQRLALLKQLRSLRLDTALGMFASEVTTWFIIATTGSVLNAHGITNIATADQAALALRPLAGPFAEAVFALGIVGTGLLAVPVLAGSAAYGIAETFGWHEGLAKTFNHARGFYGVIGAATLVGLAINFLGVNPIAALVYTAVINGVVAVPLLVLILLVANNRSVMGEHTNGRLSNVVGIAATALMGAAALITVAALFWH